MATARMNTVTSAFRKQKRLSILGSTQPSPPLLFRERERSANFVLSRTRLTTVGFSLLRLFSFLLHPVRIKILSRGLESGRRARCDLDLLFFFFPPRLNFPFHSFLNLGRKKKGEREKEKKTDKKGALLIMHLAAAEEIPSSRESVRVVVCFESPNNRNHSLSLSLSLTISPPLKFLSLSRSRSRSLARCHTNRCDPARATTGPEAKP